MFHIDMAKKKNTVIAISVRNFGTSPQLPQVIISAEIFVFSHFFVNLVKI